MNCSEIRESMERGVQNEAHIKTCAACRAYADDLAVVVPQLQPLKQVSATLSSSAASLLKASRSQPHPAKSKWLSAGLAAGLVMAVTLAVAWNARRDLRPEVPAVPLQDNKAQEATRSKVEALLAEVDDLRGKLLELGDDTLVHLKEAKQKRPELAAWLEQIEKDIVRIQREVDELLKKADEDDDPKVRDEARDQAEKKLVQIGEAALPALRKAASKDAKWLGFLAKIESQIHEQVEVGRYVRRIKAAAARVREEAWEGGFKDIRHVVEEAFALSKFEVGYVHLASRYEVGDHLETADNEDYGKFKGFAKFGGRRDILTQAIFKALSEGDGVICLDMGNIVAIGGCVVFTLPEVKDKKTWKSYFVVSLASK